MEGAISDQIATDRLDNLLAELLAIQGGLSALLARTRRALLEAEIIRKDISTRGDVTDAPWSFARPGPGGAALLQKAPPPALESQSPADRQHDGARVDRVLRLGADPQDEGVPALIAGGGL